MEYNGEGEFNEYDGEYAEGGEAEGEPDEYEGYDASEEVGGTV